jgi:hypothetical protein
LVRYLRVCSRVRRVRRVRRVGRVRRVDAVVIVETDGDLVARLGGQGVAVAVQHRVPHLLEGHVEALAPEQGQGGLGIPGLLDALGETVVGRHPVE